MAKNTDQLPTTTTAAGADKLNLWQSGVQKAITFANALAGYVTTGTFNTHTGSKATTTALGHVMVDGTTITVDTAGKIAAAPAAGSKHVIEAPDGVDMPARGFLQFTGNVGVSDDSVNNRTVVNVPASSGTGGNLPKVTSSPYNWISGGATDSRAAIDATPAEELFVPKGTYRVARITTAPGQSEGILYGVYAGVEGGQAFGTYPDAGNPAVQFVRPFYEGQSVVFSGPVPGGITAGRRYLVSESTPVWFKIKNMDGTPVTLTTTQEQSHSSLVHLAHDLRIKRGAVLNFEKGAIIKVDADVPLGGVQIDCEVKAGLYQIFDAKPGQVIWSNGNLYDVQNVKGMGFGPGAVDMWWGATPGAPASDANRRAIQAAIDAHNTAFVTGPITRITGPLYQIRGDQHLKATLPEGTQIAESFGGGPLLFSSTRSRELKWGFVPVAGITTDGGNAMPVGKVPDGAEAPTFLDLSTVDGSHPFNNQTSYRFECYFRIDTAPATGQTHHIVEWGGREHEADTYKTYLGLRAIDGNRFQALFYIGGTQHILTPATASYAAGDVGVKRNHLAVTYDGAGDGVNGKLRFFINGALAAEANTPLNAVFDAPWMTNFLIGAAPRDRYYGRPNGTVANGVIDSVHIAVGAFYKAAFTPPTGKLAYGHGDNTSQLLLNFDQNEQGFTNASHRGDPIVNPRAWLFGYNPKYSFFADSNTVTGINFDSTRCIGIMAYAQPIFRAEKVETTCFIGLHLYDNCFSSEFFSCKFRGRHSSVIAHQDCGVLIFDDLFTKGGGPQSNNFVLALNSSATVRGKNFEVGRYQFYAYESVLNLEHPVTTDEATVGVKGSILASVGSVVIVHGGVLESANPDAPPVVTVDGAVSVFASGVIFRRRSTATEIFRQVRAPLITTRLIAAIQSQDGGGYVAPASYTPWSSTAGAVTVIG